MDLSKSLDVKTLQSKKRQDCLKSDGIHRQSRRELLASDPERLLAAEDARGCERK